MDDIIKVVAFARACAEEAMALRDKYSKDREDFLASVGQVWDVSGPNPLIDPAWRCDSYATSVATFAKNGRYGWVHSWTGRTVEALVNALNIAEVDATEVLDRLMKEHGVCMIEGSVFALDGETRTFTTHRVHTNRSGWTVTSDTKTIQQGLPNGERVKK